MDAVVNSDKKVEVRRNCQPQGALALGELKGTVALHSAPCTAALDLVLAD